MTDATPTAPANKSIASGSGSKGNELSDRELLLWGCAGGFLFVAVTLGLFDLTRIKAMLEASRDPTVQVIGIAIQASVTLIAAAVWTRVHKPIQSTFVALQLGIIAPLAITAMIESFTPGQGTTDVAAASKEGVFETASAKEKPSIVKCIVRSLVKRPC